MEQNLGHAIAVALAALTPLLSGCSVTTTVRVPATELPSLSTGEMANAASWPELRTVDGQTWRMMGTVDRVRVHYNSEIASVAPPFTAKIDDERLQIFSGGRRSTFALKNISSVSIDYYDAKASRKRAGIVMIALGGACLPLAAATAIGPRSAMRTDEYTWRDPLFRIAGALLAIHLILTPPGIYLASTDPARPNSPLANVRPILHISPDGAAISSSF